MLRIDDMQRQAVDFCTQKWYNSNERGVYMAKNYLLIYAEQLATDIELLCKN